MSVKNIAIIVAGGSGTRFSSAIPKQYTASILTNTIKKFLSSKSIDAIQVIIRPEDVELYKKATEGLISFPTSSLTSCAASQIGDLISITPKIPGQASLARDDNTYTTKLLPAVFGGKTRAESVKNGLKAISSYNPEIALVHDANRPFVSVKLIEQIIKELENNPNHGIAPTLPISDTVKRITSNEAETINRENLFSIQTPQGFHYKQLVEAYNKADILNTDESSLDIPIIYILGEKQNIKITYREDISMETRSGTGFDAHRFAPESSKENNIILGGITIPFERKLEAHSDGDVLIHALVDALLGAIGAWDIGMHFPPSDSKWKNASSTLFLEYANELLKQKSASINNIDITIICEAPRLGVHREEIRNNLAKILNIQADRVNIKATTTEKMGFTGRGEGIAVQAIATISLPAT
jgi:2-C-methyl-D-erythritol 4-phosphate cytidylyltransferase/2-C-methyl-D-erythritol 2,4-cyclodiphosphate synthase